MDLPLGFLIMLQELLFLVVKPFGFTLRVCLGTTRDDSIDLIGQWHSDN